MRVYLAKPIQPRGVGRPLDVFDDAECLLEEKPNGDVLLLVGPTPVIIHREHIVFIERDPPRPQIQASSPPSPSSRTPSAAASRST